ncbi:hypothetical protein FHS57_002292 [Runella defluvii]|uniref:Uncharacterized protein n=1 Tax=Runella defluvii TaxID=370973 RepID=A0A7W5ZM64_9BACT|nr:hypothetical protein [Runella defluvii]
MELFVIWQKVSFVGASCLTTNVRGMSQGWIVAVSAQQLKPIRITEVEANN